MNGGRRGEQESLIDVRVQWKRPIIAARPFFAINRVRALERYFTPSNSTSNISVALGGMTPPAPRAP
jgi:hypothetical protein